MAWNFACNIDALIIFNKLHIQYVVSLEVLPLKNRKTTRRLKNDKLKCCFQQNKLIQTFLIKIKLYTWCKWTHITWDNLKLLFLWWNTHFVYTHHGLFFAIYEETSESFHSASKTMAVSSVIKAHITPLFHQLHISDVLLVFSIPF